MRLDKYLKDARIVKRRTVAKILCDAGKVRVDGKVAKAGLELRGGEWVEVEYAGKRIRVLVGPPGGPPYLSREEERISGGGLPPHAERGDSLFSFGEEDAPSSR
ncbi:S4 domain-containing protein [Brockia lithotrophica]|uniref:S4 domain-containing protein n=1 Tax=Brockia lithotrophica TaxID=933949 RepID=A0A660KW41_9BACL|nr:S4 domain-containing protein [Brockia lithotrophica]RKQ85626.1 S4 domain-containing protein [Brockia lithotrophica]